MRGGHDHTGDVAQRSADGWLTSVGRSDDVFKASDYRISPFELRAPRVLGGGLPRARGLMARVTLLRP